MLLSGYLEIPGVCKLQRRNAAVSLIVCPQSLFVFRIVKHNGENLGPIVLKLWPEVHLIHKSFVGAQKNPRTFFVE